MKIDHFMAKARMLRSRYLAEKSVAKLEILSQVVATVFKNNDTIPSHFHFEGEGINSKDVVEVLKVVLNNPPDLWIDPASKHTFTANSYNVKIHL